MRHASELGTLDDLAARFWPKVDVLGPAECWEWQAARDTHGYGRIGNNRGPILSAHRVAWELTNGQMPDDMWVLHRCDNPPCVNPAHLFLGTQRDNMQDMYGKDRHPRTGGLRGVENVNAKLNPLAAEDIRTRYAAGGVSQQKLADEYGVSQVAVSMIVRGKTWRQI